MARLALMYGELREEHKRELRERRNERRLMRYMDRAFAVSEDEFMAHYRVSREIFDGLFEDFKNIIPQPRRKSDISLKHKILVTLSFYATGSYQRLVGRAYGTVMSQQSVSRAIREITEALNNPVICNKWIKFPRTIQERNAIKIRFFDKFGIPGVLGCIDGTHVAIIRPKENEERFYNRKHFHSRNVLIICDADLNILSVDSSFGGASHDSFIWNQHPVKNHMIALNNNGEDVYLLASVHGLAGMPSLLIPYIMQLRGRKFGFRLCCTLVLLGWLIIYAATDALTIIVGESVQGLGAKSLLVVSYITMSEMVDPKFRNISLLLYGINQTLGITLVHILGRFIHWKTISLLMGVPVIVAFIQCCIWPESPAWLAYKGRFDDCKKSFVWLRGKSENSLDELNALLTAQKEYLKTYESSNNKWSIRDAWEKITSRDFYLPSLHMFILLCVYYWSGNLVFLVYAMNMVEEVTKDENAAFIGMVIMDVMTLFGNILSSVFFRFFNNKPILISSGVGSAVFLLISSIVSYLKVIEVLPADSLLCLYSLIGFMIASSLGVYTIPYAMSAEIMPLRHRGVGGALIVITICSSYSFTLKMAPYFVMYLGLHGTFLLYAITLCLCLSYVWKFVPETKNRTLQSIEESFVKNDINKDMLR